MKNMVMEEEVVIVGAGIAGLATAVALKRIGVPALVLERSQGLRTTGTALTLLPNAWVALDALGVSHKLTSVYAPLERGFITDVKTGAIQEVSFPNAINGTEAAGPRPVRRKSLLEALADEVSIDTIRFSSKVAAIETQTQDGSPIVVVHLDDGTVIKAKVLIGCDGVHSVVGHWLGLPAPVNSGRSGFRGLTVFPQGHGLNKVFQQFVDSGTRAGFIPLTDKEIFWFFIYQSPPNGETMGRNPELMQRELLENYAKNLPPQFLTIIRHCDLSTLSWAPLMFRQPWKIMLKKLSKDNITVAGDAMHPMTPDLGQGGCSALEDAVVLGRHIGQLLTKNGKFDSRDIGEAIDGYVKERKWRVSWLVTGSYISGWVQQGGYNWWMKFLRDVIFYRFFLPRIANIVRYDCGKLPSVSDSSQVMSSSKID